MKTRVFMTSLLALAVLAPAANALTVQNEDKTEYTLKVTPKGGKEADVVLKAAASATVDCKAGCEIKFGDQTKAVDGKATTLMIKGGKFV